MRHLKQRHSLGLKKAHRLAVMATMAASLFQHGRIKTTEAKAKALRPFSEQIITLAKKAAATEDASQKLHYRRLAIARVRDVAAVRKLFDELAPEFANRSGGYTRIYKLGTRIGDAAEMAIIEIVKADDEGHAKPKRAKKKAAKPAAAPAADEVVAEEAPAEPVAEAVEAEGTEAK
jgi:large subunit ribosomal protein L17